MKVFIALCLLGVALAAQPGNVPKVVWKDMVGPSPSEMMEGKITNGEGAWPGQFPYQVGLLIAKGNAWYWCGGSLISQEWILTAAHCTEGSHQLIAYIGAINKDDSNEWGQQRISVPGHNIIVHENYHGPTISNDISVVKLPWRVGFNDRVSAVALPRRNGQYSDYAGWWAIASGWGQNQHGQGPSHLQWVNRPIISEAECRRTFNVDWRQICINTNNQGGQSTCSGDSGGPLVLADGERRQVGITSFGAAAGCTRGYPAAFTRVTSFLDWIAHRTGVSH